MCSRANLGRLRFSCLSHCQKFWLFYALPFRGNAWEKQNFRISSKNSTLQWRTCKYLRTVLRSSKIHPKILLLHGILVIMIITRMPWWSKILRWISEILLHLSITQYLQVCHCKAEFPDEIWKFYFSVALPAIPTHKKRRWIKKNQVNKYGWYKKGEYFV